METPLPYRCDVDPSPGWKPPSPRLGGERELFPFCACVQIRPFGKKRPKIACDNRRLAFYYRQAMEFAFLSLENRATPKAFGADYFSADDSYESRPAG